MHNHYSAPRQLPVTLALPAINLSTTSGAPTDGSTPNVATATLIDLLIGQYIAFATVHFPSPAARYLRIIWLISTP